MDKKTAFTLIELLVVIAIIGILSGLIIVSMSGVTSKASIAKLKVFSNSLKNSLMANLISEWKFDNISGTVDQAITAGTTVADSWGSNSGTTGGSLVLRGGNNCVSGNCIESTGTGQYVNCGTSNFNISNEVTIEFWIKAGSQPGTSWRGIVYKKSYQDTTTYAVRNCGGAGIYFTANPNGGTNGMHMVIYGLLNNNWRHIVTSYDGNVGKMYVDGVLSNTSPSASFTIDSTSSSLYIGSSGNSDAFVGILDDVKIYNDSVPVSQIKENYYSGLNSLYIKGEITRDDYISRVNEIALKY